MFRDPHLVMAAERPALVDFVLIGEVGCGKTALMNALLATIAEVSTIVYLQVANNPQFAMPAGLMQVYPHKRVVGVISKIDLPDADVSAARRLLRDNNIDEPYFETSAATGAGVDRLRRYLTSLQGDPVDAGPHKPVRAA